MRSVRMPFAAAVLLASAALILASCSSSPSASRGGKHHHHKGSATTTTSSSTTTTSSSTTSTTSAPATTAVSKCQTANLRVSLSGSQGAAGTQEATFALTNVAGAPCTTYGYPGMLLLTTAGAPLPTTVDRGGTLSFEKIAPSLVHLAPGATAYFNAGYSDVQQGNAACSSAQRVEVTPPTNATSAVVVTTIRACDNGTIHVSAVFASTNAAATQTTAR